MNMTNEIVMLLPILTKILISTICGAIVGYERELKNKSAGLRTIILISVGSCLFTIASFVAAQYVGDPTRILSTIVTGIGFLGGGVIVQHEDKLIGITTAIATADVGAEGLGFAVPVNLALGIADDLLKEGRILHAFLGILGAQHFDTAEDGARVFSGVIIQELYGPGNEVFAIGKAGALAGDIIKKINGVNVKTLDGLITVLRQKRAGDTVEIEILRNSQTITLVFELDLRPSDV